MNTDAKWRPWSLITSITCALVVLVQQADGRSFRVNMMPNGSVNSCANCHNRASGGGPRTPFGEAVHDIVGNSRDEFWTAALALMDSDGDGATNGEELGDPDGDGTPIDGAEVFNPGDPASVPAPAEGEIYEQNFDGFADDETELGDGSIIASNDGTNSVQNGALRVTAAGTNSTAASFVLPPYDGSEGWSAIFDFVIEHTGGNTPADGFSFNYGEIPEGENFGSPAEEGYGDGVPHISYQMDTWKWDDPGQDAGVGIEVAGQEIAFTQAINDEANFKPNELVSGSMLVSWDPANGASFQTAGLRTEADFVNIPTPDFDAEASYGFSILARTGGHNETFIVDNLKVGPLGSFELKGRDPRIEGDTSLNIAAGFGSTETGQFLVANEGAENDLVIDSATLGGDSPNAFKILTDFPLTLAPGESAMIEVEFTAPSVLGTVSAHVVLPNNDTLELAANRIVELMGTPFAEEGLYVQDFDSFPDETTELDDGSIIQSNDEAAKIVGGALQLTEVGTGGSSASFKLPALGPDGNEAFIATFDLKLETEGTPADGFSFNYGNIADDATGSEEGFSSGLAMEFDTYNNGGEGADSGIGYDVSVDGRDVEGGIMRIAAGDDPADNEFYKFDGQWRPVQISWFKTGEDTGVFSLIVDGKVFYDNLETPGFKPEPGYRFAFAARTGGANETVQIDNLRVETGTEDPNLFTTDRVDSGVVEPDAGLVTLEIPVRNTGTETNLNISNVTLDPSDGGVYALVSFPSTLAPGQGDFIEVTMDPAGAEGRSSAELTIESNDPSQPTQVITLSVSVPLTSGLAGWYKMDETGGGILVDSSGHGRNGNYAGDVTFGQDALATGSSVLLNTTGDQSAFGSISGFPGSSLTSVSMWVQMTGASPTGVATLFSKSHPEDEAAYSLSQFSGDLLAWVVSEDPNSPAAAVAGQALGEPTHVVVVYEDSAPDEEGAESTTIYLNGVAVATEAPSLGFRDADDAFQIGARIGTNGMVGLVDDVQIYRIALTGDEVGFLFNNPGQIVDREPPPPPTLPEPEDGMVIYEQSFDFPDDTTELGDGSLISSNDGIASVQNGTLRLTEVGVNSSASNYIIRKPAFDTSKGWTATFDFTIEHTGDNTPADGFSFNFGAIPEPGDGAEFGNPAEEGYGPGIDHVSFQVDTWLWDNPDQDAGVGIEVSGAEAAFVPANGENANFQPEERVSGSATVSWHPENGASFTTTGLRTNANFVNVATDGFTVPSSGFDEENTYGFSFLARTGGHNETVEIDNFRVVADSTGGGVVPPPTSDLTISNVAYGAGGEGTGVSFTILPDGTMADVEYSADLVNWEVVAQGVGSFEETDPDRVEAPIGHYRAVEPQQ